MNKFYDKQLEDTNSLMQNLFTSVRTVRNMWAGAVSLLKVIYLLTPDDIPLTKPTISLKTTTDLKEHIYRLLKVWNDVFPTEYFLDLYIRQMEEKRNANKNNL